MIRVLVFIINCSFSTHRHDIEASTMTLLISIYHYYITPYSCRLGTDYRGVGFPVSTFASFLLVPVLKPAHILLKNKKNDGTYTTTGILYRRHHHLVRPPRHHLAVPASALPPRHVGLRAGGRHPTPHWRRGEVPWERGGRRDPATAPLPRHVGHHPTPC